MTFSVSRDGQICICSGLFSILGVWLWFGLQLRLELVLKVSGLVLGLRLVLVGLDVCMGMENSACHVYLSVLDGK